MRFIQTPIEGLMVFEPTLFTDERGKFVKTYNDDFFRAHGLDITIKESYYSLSAKDVIRGMHFQTPPHDHIKIVYVPNGKIIDVVLDIRKGSPSYGTFFDIELSSENGKILIIPKGLAHGFKSIDDNTNVTYMQTSCYAPENDFGIHYNSFGYDWGVSEPKLSERDASFVFLDSFESPFVYGETQ